jgi:hypothetical protein
VGDVWQEDGKGRCTDASGELWHVPPPHVHMHMDVNRRGGSTGWITCTYDGLTLLASRTPRCTGAAPAHGNRADHAHPPHTHTVAFFSSQ